MCADNRRLHGRRTARELRSEDRPTRDEARRKLAAIGGRAIEPAIPELVASAVFDASPPGRPYDYWVWVFVGRVVQRDEVAHTETYEFDRWLPGAPFKGELKRRTVETPENAAPSLREPSRSREIVVVRALQHHYDSADPHERRLAVPLPEDEQGIIDAVSERLRNLRMGEHP